MQTRRTKETTSLKAREFLTPERLLTLQERNGTTNATVREARLDETTMERGEGADVAEDVAVLEDSEAVEDPEVAVGRESLTGSPATAGLGSRPRTREVEVGRATGETLRTTSR